MNDDKKEFIVFKFKYNINAYTEQNVKMEIKNLYVTFD